MLRSAVERNAHRHDSRRSDIQLALLVFLCVASSWKHHMAYNGVQVRPKIYLCCRLLMMLHVIFLVKNFNLGTLVLGSIEGRMQTVQQVPCVTVGYLQLTGELDRRGSPAYPARSGRWPKTKS